MINALCCAVEGRQDKNLSKILQLLCLVGGVGASALNNQNMPRKLSDYVHTGKLIAFQVPPMTLLPLTTSLGLAHSIAPTMIDLPSLEGIDVDNPDVRTMDEGQRMLWVLLKCGEILSQTGKSEVATAFKQLLEPQVIGLVVAGLIVWGASHFVGVGFILDIAAVVVMGLAVLKAFEVMWDIYKIIRSTTTKNGLENAANKMSKMVIDLGVETFLAIVLKGAAKSRFRAMPKGGAGSADEAAEIAPSARKRGTAAPSSTSKAAFKDDVHKGNHNKSELELVDRDTFWKDHKFETKREIDMEDLSASDQKIKRVLEDQGRTRAEIKELLKSSTTQNTILNKPYNKGDKFYGFVPKGEGKWKSTDNKYWLDQAGYNDVEKRFFRDGAWDKQGVKNYLALPCVNSADDIVTAVAKKDGFALQTDIGEATEMLPYLKEGGLMSNSIKMMGGGGAQVTPPKDLLDIVSTGL